MNDGHDFVTKFGVTLQSTYPYTASTDTCNEKLVDQPAVHAAGRFNVPSNSTDALLDAIAQGPVSVAIEADSLWFQFY
jgi:KDEL-tailed cysteine endopeptidase